MCESFWQQLLREGAVRQEKPLWDKDETGMAALEGRMG